MADPSTPISCTEFMKTRLPPHGYQEPSTEKKNQQMRSTSFLALRHIGATLWTNKTVLRQNDYRISEIFLDEQPPVYALPPFYRVLYTEADVADSYYTHALAPFQTRISVTLDSIFKSLPPIPVPAPATAAHATTSAASTIADSTAVADSTATADTTTTTTMTLPAILRHYEYKIRIYSQPLSKNEPETEAKTKWRQDHTVVLEPSLCKLEGRERHPTRAAIAHSSNVRYDEKEFSNFLHKCWQDQKPKDWHLLPNLVLFVVEEKAPGLVIDNDWSEDYTEDIEKPESSLVLHTIPQLRIYASALKCKYIFLTDYLTTILLFFEKNELEETRRKKKTLPYFHGKPAMILKETTFHPTEEPRMILFTTAIRRLCDLGVISSEMLLEGEENACVKGSDGNVDVIGGASTSTYSIDENPDESSGDSGESDVVNDSGESGVVSDSGESEVVSDSEGSRQGESSSAVSE